MNEKKGKIEVISYSELMKQVDMEATTKGILAPFWGLRVLHINNLGGQVQNKNEGPMIQK